MELWMNHKWVSIEFLTESCKSPKPDLKSWLISDCIASESGLNPDWLRTSPERVLSGSRFRAEIRSERVLIELWLSPERVLTESWLNPNWIPIDSEQLLIDFWLNSDWFLYESSKSPTVSLNWVVVTILFLCAWLCQMDGNGVEFRRQHSRALWWDTWRLSQPPTTSLAAPHNELPGRGQRR